MALIKCSECGKEISDRATTCPNCGNPLIANPTELNPVTIQQTRKKWKVWTAIAVVMLIVGWLMIMNGLAGGNPTLGSFGAMILFFGFVIGIIGRIGAWWSNG